MKASLQRDPPADSLPEGLSVLGMPQTVLLTMDLDSFLMQDVKSFLNRLKASCRKLNRFNFERF